MAQPKNTTTAPAGKGSAAFDAAAQAARGPAQDVQNDEPEPDPDAQALVKSVKGGEIAVANGVWTSAPKYIQLAKLGDQITGRILLGAAITMSGVALVALAERRFRAITPAGAEPV